MTHLAIDLEKMKLNVAKLKSFLNNGTLLMAVVKANAYGHGLVASAKAAIEGGANWLGVVALEEGMALRKENIHKPILVLGAVALKDARLAANQEIAIAVFSMDQVRELSEISFDKALKIHLKVDTGLNRLGLEVGEISQAIRLISSNKGIVLEGVFSHFASVEENNLEFAKIQIEKFKEALKVLKELKYEKIIKHMAATSAALVLPDSHFDMVRCGIGIYGLWPSLDLAKKFDNKELLEPVLSFKTEIVQTKNVKKGEKIGYGCTFEAKEDMVIGIIPVGYAEGLDRGLSNNIGEVLVSGQHCSIIGRVCMNMSIVKLKAEREKLKVGQEVTIIGEDGDQEITVDEIAQKLGTINYEIVARLPEHLERKYI